MQTEISTPAQAGFALIKAHMAGETSLNRRSAQFAGQLVANDAPLTPAQADWLDKLLLKAGLPAIGGE